MLRSVLPQNVRLKKKTTKLYIVTQKSIFHMREPPMYETFHFHNGTHLPKSQGISETEKIILQSLNLLKSPIHGHIQPHDRNPDHNLFPKTGKRKEKNIHILQNKEGIKGCLLYPLL